MSLNQLSQLIPAHPTKRYVELRSGQSGVIRRWPCGTAWNSVMYDCMLDTDCDADDDCALGECCGSRTAPIYFISFVIFGSFVTLNLLIAVVLDNFSNSKKEEGVNVTSDNIEEFAAAWKKLDPYATGFIPLTRLVTLLKNIGSPLGVKGKKLSRIGILRFQKNLSLKVDSNYLHYQDVLQALTSRAMVGSTVHRLYCTRVAPTSNPGQPSSLSLIETKAR